ncbi:nuclear pore complex protein Nup214 [Diabrotica virgifera virgifera]|uniref:Nucleoporin Nup159/Nup146 N-terminal domain-containing protein n=1 Tax=Diabrotica virgifera virgifera TaxID=50390 RepID=A0ABM5KVW4_DIAVI|nr:nuclear pore complex protein Nup214 [Diabrotica virgifera virgifera]
MLKTCPDPVDINDIQFKLHCSLKIFDNSSIETFQNNNSLISCASRYGLLFAGSNSPSLKVIQVKTVENFTHKDKEISQFPRRTIPLPSPAKHVSVNCDSTLLAVVIQRDNCPVVIFYDVLSFYKQNVVVVKEVRLSATPGTFITEVGWNPAIPGIFTACKNDKILGVYELKGSSVEINELPAAAGSVSFSWSPKGKQIAVGSITGTIVQYKPDLKAVRKIEAPPFETAPSLISLCWVSNFQFIGVYQFPEDAKLIVVDAPKTGETNYTNYDDVCYSGSTRISQFYLILLQHWNLLMIASSNSMELGLLGLVSEIWTQWNVPDFARAELPLGSDKQETLPVGMALDISNTKPLPWGEGLKPPCPYLLLLSHTGVLYFYNLVNLKEGIPSINSPPDAIADSSGLAQFVLETQQAEVAATPPKPQQPFSFGNVAQPVAVAQPLITPAPAKVIPQTSQPSFDIIKPIVTQPTPPFGLPQGSVPPGQSLFDKSLGPQVTITPVKQQPQISAPSIFGGAVTLTPVKSQPQNVETSEKYSAIYSALKAPSMIPAPADPRPILIATKQEGQPVGAHPVLPDPRSVPMPELVALEPIKFPTAEAPRIIVTPKTAKNVPHDVPKTTMPQIQKTDVDPKLAIDEQVKGETQAILTKMVKEECLALESELKALLHQGRKINVNIGNENEKIMMIKELQDLQEFVKEIVDVSLGESAEVHSLKQNLVLSWAWYEEALSRYNLSKDETMGLILKSQPLDSATEKRQSDIKKMMYYLDSQLSQASKALDEQWDNFQDYTKKSYRVQMPTMEAIFQTMVRQGALLQKQNYILKDISSNANLKQMSKDTSSLFVGLKKIEDLKYLRLDPDDDYRILHEQIRDRNKKLTSSKTQKLRDFLKHRDITHVTAARPKLNTSLTRSPTVRGSHVFSILGAEMSPVMKPAVVKNLKFSESTPLKLMQDIKPTLVPPNTPAQPEPSKTFTFKSLDKNVLPPNVSTYYPVTKNLLSNLTQTPISSAFVPTTQATKNFTSSAGLTFTTPSTVAVEGTPSQTSVAQSLYPNLSQYTFDSTSTSTKPESSVPSQGKVTFSFKSNVDVSSELPSQNTGAQSFFSFGKPASSAIATASLQTVATTTSSKSLLGTPGTADTGSLLTAPKPNFFSTAPLTILQSTTSTSAQLPQTTSVSNVSKPSTPLMNLNTASVALTTTTTSLFGSISSPSVSTSFFGTKPLTSSAKVASFGDVKSTGDGDRLHSTTDEATISSTIATSTTSIGALKTPSSSSGSISVTKSGFTPVVSSTSMFAPGTAISTKVGSLFSSIPPATSIKSTFNTSTSASVFPTISSSSSGISISSKSSIFDKTESTQGSVFTSTATVTESSIFGNTGSTAQTTLFASQPTVQSSSEFGTPVITQTSTVETPKSTQASVFGTAATQPSIFASPATTQSSIFSPASTQPSLFSTPTTTKSSIFTSEAPTQSSPFSNTAITQPSIFASPTSTSTTTQSTIFASVATTQPSIFSTPTTTQSSGFGTPTTTPGTIFGATTSTATSTFGMPTATSSAFGASSASPLAGFGAPSITAPAATSSSTFGASSTSPLAGFGAPSLTAPAAFGSQNTTQSSIFGVTTTTKSSIFGSPSTTQSSVFGTPSTTTQAPFFATTQSSVFGGQSTGSIFSSTTPSAFGSASPTSTQGSIFGAASPVSSSSSIFGAPATTSSGFGQTTGSIFGSSGFGATATTTAAFSQPATFGSNSGSIFGTPATSNNSVFGSGSNSFGAASTSSSVFGSTPSSSFSFASAANNAGSLGFGNLNVGNTSGNSIFGAAPTFNQPNANPFASATNIETPSTTGSIFGSGSTSSGFGSGGGSSSQSIFATNTFGSAGGFGQQSSFGQSTFGQQSFGSPQAGPFSGGGVGVGQTGFGSPGGFQKQQGGFGGAPVFGGSPQAAFGSSPSFASPPAFGGAPSFGSPAKVFGSNAPPANFGNAGAASPGFGNLASQNTVGFGSLAQQASSSPSTPFSGSSSFSSWR